MNVDGVKFKVKTVIDKIFMEALFQQLVLNSVIKTVSMFYLKITPI